MSQHIASLYGKDPENIKAILTTDNVLQKGELYDYDTPFTTTKADDYKSWGPVRRPPEINQGTLETNINFGSYQGENMSIQNSDYNIKKFTKVKNFKPPNSINIIDMNPMQETDKIPISSSYADEFNKDSLARHRSENKVIIYGPGNPTTSYLRATHFSLGSDPPDLQTEAQAAYSSARTKTSKNSEAAERALHDKHTNNVFRAGDYNIVTKEPSSDTVYSISYSKQKEQDHSDHSKISDTKFALSKKLYNYLRDMFPNARDPSQVNLRQAFAHFDKNGTGFMSFECLARVLKRLLEPHEHGEVRDIISLFDVNNDEKIDYVEFENFLNQRFPFFVRDESTDKEPYKPSLLEGRARQRLIEEPPVDGSYQISTHFKLGETGESCAESLYQSKFGGLKQVQSPAVAKPLPPSQILPVEPEHMQTANTIQREDYSCQHSNLSKMAHERKANILANKSLNENASFTMGQERVSENELGGMSMTASAYQPKQLAKRPGKVSGFQSQWNHLTTEDALPELTSGPRVSEHNDAYKTDCKTALNEYSSNKNLRLLRVADEKTSHLSFGNDSNEGQISEMVVQFRKPEVNPDCPAAGIKGGPIEEHQHIHHSENQSTLSDPSVKSLQDAIKQTILEKCYNPGDPLNINLQKAFKEFDRNDTGKITVTGLREACKRLQLPVEDATLQKFFLALDKNKDGSIDYHEFADELGIHIQTVTSKGMTSVMQGDYTPINERRQSRGGTEVVPKKQSIPSHYFHMNHSIATPGTTTQHDFTHPVEKLNWSSYPPLTSK